MNRDELPLTRLREQRLRLRLTQRQVADRTGLSLRTVRALETGQVSRPTPRTLRLMTDVLGLSGGPGGPALVGVVTPEPLGPMPRAPAQLPPAVADFTGRAELRSRVARALRSDRAVVLVTGRGGVGKTALVVHVAQRESPRYPGGQLFADLRATSGRPRAPEEVRDLFLRALGVDDGAVSGSPEARAARYRALLAERRVLVVLDDAHDAAQVRTLLPGAGCGVLVTARRRLEGLTGAHPVQLGTLGQDEALALLAAVAGHGRVLREPVAAAAVVRWCDGLPLAVRVAGLRLLAEPDRPVGWLAELLADGSRRLDELRAGDLDVRAALASSLRLLTLPESEALRLLGAMTGRGVTVDALAAALGTGEAAADAVLRRLADAHLIRCEDETARRYRLDDLVWRYARELAGDAAATASPAGRSVQDHQS